MATMNEKIVELVKEFGISNRLDQSEQIEAIKDKTGKSITPAYEELMTKREEEKKKADSKIVPATPLSRATSRTGQVDVLAPVKGHTTEAHQVNVYNYVPADDEGSIASDWVDIAARLLGWCQTYSFGMLTGVLIGPLFFRLLGH